MLIRGVHCDTCEFEMPTGFGGYGYVERDDGERERLKHPGEQLQVRSVLGEDASDELIEARTGYVHYCACRDCGATFELEFGEHEEACHWCGSEDVATRNDLIDERCPKCEAGTVVSETHGVA